MELAQKKKLKLFLSFLVVSNTLLFFVMAYFEKISNTPDMIVFVDFWGRITVYSLWFMCYEAYHKYLGYE